MDSLKLATDWAKAEVFSTQFFIGFGILFVLASIGFWQLGKSDIAKAYIIPTLVAGVLLLIIGLGLFFTNKARLNHFETAYHADETTFVQTEITRAQDTLKEYQTIVFTAIPLIITAIAVLMLFMNSPIWRASLISALAMLVVILLVDGTAHNRIENYHKQLLSHQTTWQKTNKEHQ